MDGDFLAATCAQIVTRTVLAPFDRVKVLTQLEPELRRINRLPIGSTTLQSVLNQPTPVWDSQHFGRSFRIFRHLVYTEGVFSLWRGNLWNVAAIGLGAPLGAFIVVPAQTRISNFFFPINAQPEPLRQNDVILQEYQNRTGPLVEGGDESAPNQPSWATSTLIQLSGLALTISAALVLYPLALFREILICDYQRDGRFEFKNGRSLLQQFMNNNFSQVFRCSRGSLLAMSPATGNAFMLSRGFLLGGLGQVLTSVASTCGWLILFGAGLSTQSILPNALVAASAAVLTLPLDTLRRRYVRSAFSKQSLAEAKEAAVVEDRFVQAEARNFKPQIASGGSQGQKVSPKTSTAYPGVLECASFMITEGKINLFRGACITSIRATIAVGVGAAVATFVSNLRSVT